MFDVLPEEIAQLDDTALRELVGRLCEAELVSRGLSPVAVTWGGNQRAPDGGVDVRVALPPNSDIHGFIPRSATVFQVKAQDMPRSAIQAEMRPKGVLRPAIRELAEQAGAYIIVSSRENAADLALIDRKAALRDALAEVANAENLHTDFYDRTRMASWVRRHPGLIIWVKEKIGRALPGWRPYGPWSGASEGIEAEYLLDDRLRLHLHKRHDAPTKSVTDGIDDLRDELAPRKAVRLVGLSGVGKTRLVQALFDARVGSRPLPSSLAVYTNLADNPSPQPAGLASDMIANRMRAILIADNCPQDLHRRLADICGAPDSTVSVLTVEYDVRDDQPPETQVVTLDTSSPELIEQLVTRRFPHLSQVDTRTIARVSGGNARIAIALAGTVEKSDTIAGLSDDELFQRLFRQRQDPNDALLLAAQACSLVYSFHGEALTGSEAELPRLAILANQAPSETYGHVGELLRRQLVQMRGVWRAVLPHALANRLAARALEDIPFDLIDQQLVTGGSERLARSFSRRLSFLHDHPRAKAIVDRWLAPGGFLGDATAFNELGRAMLENVAPVSPEAALECLERASEGRPDVAAMVWRRHLSLLRSLAYDPQLFERCASLLAQAAARCTEDHDAKTAWDTFASLFTIYFSGTHATIEQRLQVIERLLRSDEPKRRSLALYALRNVLETSHFSGLRSFEFGAWSRDYGRQPRTNEDVTEWYGAALTLIERFAFIESVLKSELLALLAQEFRGLWISAGVCDQLEALCRRKVAEGFWRDGWIACRQTMKFQGKSLTPERRSLLATLEADLRPTNLAENVRAWVLGDWGSQLSLEDSELDNDVTGTWKRLDAFARELGAAVANDEAAFEELIPELVHGGVRVSAFGGSLMSEAADRRATWEKFVDGLTKIPREERDAGIFCGCIGELWERDRDLAQELLDDALAQPTLAPFIPSLQSAVPIDARGVDRLKRALSAGLTPVRNYRALGGAANQIAGHDLKDLILQLLAQTQGFDVALHILSMRLHSDRSAQRPHEPELMEAAREFLRHVKFVKSNERQGYYLASVARAGLTGPDAAGAASGLASRLRHAVAANETDYWHHHELLKILLAVQTISVLDALVLADDSSRWAGMHMLARFDDIRPNPADAIACDDLISWCELDPVTRYPIAASFISFSSHTDDDGPRAWSEQATMLMANAPDRKSVLSMFIARFHPMSCSGSRASLMEANARLLDDLEEETPDITSFIAEAKAELARNIASERRSETKYDQDHDERFE